MSFRIVLIENSATLRYKLDNIIVRIGEEETIIPISDISTIVIDNYDSNLSTRILSKMSENNITLIVCDSNHLPIGSFLPINTHSRACKVIKRQIEIEAELQNEFWRIIVKKKIENQLKLLIKFNASQLSIDRLKDYHMNVKEADITNREGHAAKVYFNELMGQSFSRGDDTFIVNSGFNYGYSIFRSFLARLCVAYGLNTMIGIHHKNEYNQFCLVDDIIEPFRPIIDYYVINNLKDGEVFTYLHRRNILNILNHRIIYKNKKQFINNAMEEYVSSISNFYEEKNLYKIEMPDFENYLGEEI